MWLGDEAGTTEEEDTASKRCNSKPSRLLLLLVVVVVVVVVVVDLLLDPCTTFAMTAICAAKSAKRAYLNDKSMFDSQPFHAISNRRKEQRIAQENNIRLINRHVNCDANRAPHC
jgi:hypothetical protein